MARLLSNMEDAQMKGAEEISALVFTILQPAVAGGLSEERAEEIYNDIMGNIAKMGKNKDGITAFEMLLDDILHTWFLMTNK